jgi:hypothetical protein
MLNNWPQKEKSGWHEIIFYLEDRTTLEYVLLRQETMDWILENIDAPHRHVHWLFSYYQLIFRFRHERDYLRFVLRWR